MDTDFAVDLHPDYCVELGLECRSCTECSARQLANLCATLGGTRLESTFFRMYPAPGCAGMLTSFVQSYFEATEPGVHSLGRLEVATAAA